MLFVTHQLDLVRNLCDRALWLDRGRVTALGDPVRVVDAYLQSVSGQKPADEAQAVVTAGPLAGEDENELAEEERWGSGEIVLSRVALVDPRGRELVALGPDATVAIEMDVNVRQPQEDFVFGVGIFHADGTCVYGTNTDIEGYVPGRMEGDGQVRFEMQSLDLVAGSYRIDAAVHTRSGRAFDYRRGVLRFVVGARVHDTGVYRPPHRWTFQGGIVLKRIEDLHRDLPAPLVETMKELELESAPGTTRYRKRRGGDKK